MTENYQKRFEFFLKQIKARALGKPSLLLHACCAPCGSYVLELLAEVFDITIFYYNPNIHPQAEYKRRLEELKRFLREFPQAKENNVKLIEADYNPSEYFAATKVEEEIELQSEDEKGERCRRCYFLRMKKSFEFALQNNFDWFTTTLSISPHKDAKKINEIGIALECGKNTAGNLVRLTKYLPADFKKKNGFLRSTQLSKEYNLWRQDYCGCVFSMKARDKKQTKSAQTQTDFQARDSL